jgi:hypothetical protein
MTYIYMTYIFMSALHYYSKILKRSTDKEERLILTHSFGGFGLELQVSVLLLGSW